MHIGIDARMAAIAGGHGRYITNLITQLMAIDTRNRYTLFVLEKDRTQFTVPNDHWAVVPADVHWYTLREQITFPRILAHHPVDLMHFPHWNVPLIFHRPFVVTIHDLTLLRFPEAQPTLLNPFLYRVKQLGYRMSLRHAADESTVIITPSQFVKQDIVERLGVAPEKITAIPEGVTTAPTATATLPMGVQTPYLLYVGVVYPHKNLERTITAFMRYQQHAPTRTQFVLAGKHTSFHTQLRTWILKNYPHAIPNGDILFTDEVSDEQLHTLYAHARGFVYCSLSEGFGLPPLEALAHDTPVLASNTTCLPEILGNAAFYTNPEDTDDISRGMRTLLEDEHARREARAHAPIQLLKYSWQIMAQETLRTYEQQC